MKKIFILILFLFFSISGAENIELSNNCSVHKNEKRTFLEAFEDENFSSCISNNFNKSNNKFLTLNDLENIKILKCNNSNIKSIKELNCFKNLETLDLTGNKIESLDKNIFYNLNKLTSLSLRNNKLNTLDKDLFRYNLQLKELDLGFNEIEELDKDFFINLHNLNSLYLGFNKFLSLDKDIFINQKNLESLSLKSNNIKTLDKDLFEYNLQLKELDLSFNELNNLDKDLFKNTNYLQEVSIDLSEKKINCITSSFLKKKSLKLLQQNNQSYEVIKKPKLCFLSKFKDIDKSKYKYEINYIESEKYVNGYQDSTFKPKENINRYEFVKILVESNFIKNKIYTKEEINKCKKSFKDVSPIKWYASYVCIAKKENIINGYKDDNFGGEKQITSAEALSIFFKLYANDFEKIEESYPWQNTFINFYKKISSDNINLELSHKLTREEMAKLMYQFDTYKFD